MNAEIIAIVTVGVALAGVGAALAGVILTSIRGVRQGHGAVGVAAGWENRCAERPAW